MATPASLRFVPVLWALAAASAFPVLAGCAHAPSPLPYTAFPPRPDASRPAPVPACADCRASGSPWFDDLWSRDTGSGWHQRRFRRHL